VSEISAAELRAWRKRNKLTRIAAEAAIGVPRYSLQAWEDGNRRAGGLPGWLAKLCAYYEKYGEIE
jgi:DNA-binding transcriptional regulator YiaG